MLVDIISPSYLPDYIVWLDWMYYAYKPELIFFIAIEATYGFTFLPAAHPVSYVVKGFLVWIVYCFALNGIAVG